MKKIIVIGCPGSGKSTFSRKLHDILKIPVFHLDNLYWNSDRTTVSKEVFFNRVTQVLQQDTWIIDGNYGSSLEIRFEACDTVFFLDYPVDVCLNGVKERQGMHRPDIPWIESEIDAEFIEFIKGFQSNGRPKILDCLCKYSDRTIYHFKYREEAELFLHHFKHRNEEHHETI